jgi:soluble lytic murein transglycosylase-like protein
VVAGTLGLASALVALILAAGEARAEVYRYQDERGTVHLTDSPPDHRFAKFEPSAGGTGMGINILPQSSIAWGVPHRALASGRDGPRARSYDRLIERFADHLGVPAALVKAVVKAESNFEPSAVSPAGAQGLMQLMPATAQDLGVDDPFRAEDNISGGTRYLRAMIDRYGDWRHALAAYNAGPQAVDRYDGIPPYPETQEYVERVLHYYRRYHGDFSR